MPDVGFLETLTTLLRGGGPFAAFILMIWLLEPRFRGYISEGGQKAVFVTVYVANLLIAAIMLFAAIYFWFINEGVIGGEDILAKGSITSVPVTHFVYSRNVELYQRRNQAEGGGIPYSWAVLSEDADFDDDLYFLVAPILDQAGGATDRYRLDWATLDGRRDAELEYKRDGSMCLRTRTEDGEECRPLFRETLTGELPQSDGPGAIGRTLWEGLVVGTAHAQDDALSAQSLGDLLRSPDVFARRDARQELIDAGPEAIGLVGELIALDPQSYRINLAAIAALNAWNIDDPAQLPRPVRDQAGLWLTWPDAVLRTQAIEFFARSVEPEQVAGLASDLGAAFGAPGSPALSIALSGIYREQARQANDSLVEQLKSGAAADDPAAVVAAATRINELFALAFDALAPSPVRDERSSIVSVQTRLDALGYQSSPVDGMIGPATLTAIDQFGAQTGVDWSGNPEELDLALLTEQRTTLLEEWRQALATLSELGAPALAEADVVALQARWATARDAMLDASPASYRDPFASRLGGSGASAGPDDPEALYAGGLRAILAGDWAKALADLQMLQKLHSGFRDTDAIELLIRQNLDVFATDEKAVALAIIQIAGCYGSGMPNDLRAEFEERAASADLGEAFCYY